MDTDCWRAADAFQPADLADQYRDRLVTVRKRGLAACGQHLEKMELRLRQRICQIALGITPEEIKSASGPAE